MASVTPQSLTKGDLNGLDATDQLKWTRSEFEIPQARACGGEVDGDAIYFCGNSLGLLSKKGRQHMLEELDVWSSRYIFQRLEGIMAG